MLGLRRGYVLSAFQSIQVHSLICFSPLSFYFLINIMSENTSAPDWFNIEKYGPMLRLSFREWATQIGNRIHLGKLLEIGMIDLFDEQFAMMMADPFVDLGFKATNPSDKTLYPLTVKGAKTIVDVLSEADCGDKDFCDNKLREIHPDMYAGRAHLFINLRAPKELLKKQFEAWLELSLLERDRSAAISSAVLGHLKAGHPILPFQDLFLWYTRQGLDIPSDFEMFKLLKLTGRDAARATRNKACTAFTLDYYFDLKFSASAEE